MGAGDGELDNQIPHGATPLGVYRAGPPARPLGGRASRAGWVGGVGRRVANVSMRGHSFLPFLLILNITSKHTTGLYRLLQQCNSLSWACVVAAAWWGRQPPRPTAVARAAGGGWARAGTPRAARVPGSATLAGGSVAWAAVGGPCRQGDTGAILTPPRASRRYREFTHALQADAMLAPCGGEPPAVPPHDARAPDVCPEVTIDVLSCAMMAVTTALSESAARLCRG